MLDLNGSFFMWLFCVDTIADQPDHWWFHSDWWVVIVAAVTGGVIAWQSYLTKEAVREARRTLLSTLRPKVIVRRIGIHHGTSIPLAGIPDNDPWRVEFEVVNIGGSTATVTSYHFTLTREIHCLHIPHSHQAGEQFSLEPGEEKLMSVPIDGALVMILRNIGEIGLRAGDQNTDKLFFWGRLRYIDGLGISRNTAVHRHYSGNAEMFQIVQDSELEYAD